MEEYIEKQFFEALHRYIQEVCSQNPSGPPLLNVTEGSARAEMVQALNRIIDDRVQAILKERDRRENIR